eukprot:6299035-Amphidinium_carterae.1
MAATVGPPTTYAPCATTNNPFVSNGYKQCDNPYRTLTGLPPQVEASTPQLRTERVEPRWPFVSAMFGMGGGHEPTTTTRETGS